MNIKIGSGKIKNNKLNASKIWKSFSAWWMRYYNLAFILLMIMSMFFGIYFWYLGLYVPVMTEQQKNDYRITKDKSIIFLEEDFNKIITDLDKRKEAYSSQYAPKRDVFK